jgi:hypothetical protein
MVRSGHNLEAFGPEIIKSKASSRPFDHYQRLYQSRYDINASHSERNQYKYHDFAQDFFVSSEALPHQRDMNGTRFEAAKSVSPKRACATVTIMPKARKKNPDILNMSLGKTKSPISITHPIIASCISRSNGTAEILFLYYGIEVLVLDPLTLTSRPPPNLPVMIPIGRPVASWPIEKVGVF